MMTHVACSNVLARDLCQPCASSDLGGRRLDGSKLQGEVSRSRLRGGAVEKRLAAGRRRLAAGRRRLAVGAAPIAKMKILRGTVRINKPRIHSLILAPLLFAVALMVGCPDPQ